MKVGGDIACGNTGGTVEGNGGGLNESTLHRAWREDSIVKHTDCSFED